MRKREKEEREKKREKRKRRDGKREDEGGRGEITLVMIILDRVRGGMS